MTATDFLSSFVSIVAQVDGACVRSTQHLERTSSFSRTHRWLGSDEMDRAATCKASAWLSRAATNGCALATIAIASRL
jgi:hypothetical protein